MTKCGYDVVLLDLTPKLLEIARKRIEEAGVKEKVQDIIEGSIKDLSMFNDETFDTVLCLGGTLSHIVSGKGRFLKLEKSIYY